MNNINPKHRYIPTRLHGVNTEEPNRNKSQLQNGRSFLSILQQFIVK